MVVTERLSFLWPFLRAWTAILLLSAGPLSGCTLDSEILNTENLFKVSFQSPENVDYSQSGRYSFAWDEFNPTAQNAKRNFPEKKYALSFFNAPDCQGDAFRQLQTADTFFVFDRLENDGDQVSVGVQIIDSQGLLGPMVCSPVVVKDSVAPILTETSSAYTSLSTVTLSGVCEDGLTVEISGGGVQSPSSLNCINGQYSVEVDLKTGVGAKNVRVVQTDLAGNQGIVDLIKTVVTPPSGFSYDQSVYYFPQGHPIGNELPQITGDIASYTGSLPAGLDFDVTTGEISGTPTTLGTTAVTITATGPAGDEVQTNFTIEIYHGPTTVADTVSAYPQIPKEISIAGILGNDFDPSGLTIALHGIAATSDGTATVVGSNIVYTSSSSPGPTESITYIAENSLGQTKAGTIEVSFLPIPPPDAVDDSTLTLVQSETLYVSEATLLSNDTTMAGTETLRIVGVSGAVGGTVSYNSTTRQITFVSTGFVGDAAGFNYTVEHAFGGTDTAHVTIVIQQLPPISALVYGVGDTAAMNTKLAGYSPPSMEDIFNGWGRFSGAEWYPSGTTPAGEAASWELLTSPYRVSCQVNSTDYTGFVSMEALDHYTHETVLGSTSADDDAITVIMAFVREGTSNHVLAAVRTQGGVGGEPTGWGIAYFENSVRVLTVTQGAAGPFFKTPDVGWASNMARIRVERTGDIFKAYTSYFSTDETNLPIEPSTMLTVDLNSDPLLAKFKGAKSYGYGSWSQANSFFNQAQIIGGLDPQFIYDLVNKRVYAYDNSLGYVLVNGVDPYNHLGYPREVTNPDTGKSFMLNRNKTFTLQP